MVASEGHVRSAKARSTRGRQHEQTEFQVKARKQGRVIEESDRGKFQREKHDELKE